MWSRFDVPLPDADDDYSSNYSFTQNAFDGHGCNTTQAALTLLYAAVLRYCMLWRRHAYGGEVCTFVACIH